MWQQTYSAWPAAASAPQECKPSMAHDANYPVTMSPFQLDSLAPSYNPAIYAQSMYANGFPYTYETHRAAGPANMLSHENDWNGNSYYNEVMKAYVENPATSGFDYMSSGVLSEMQAADHGPCTGNSQVKQENNMLEMSQNTMAPEQYFNPLGIPQSSRAEQGLNPAFATYCEEYQNPNLAWNMTQANVYPTNVGGSNHPPTGAHAHMREYGEYWNRTKALDLKRGMLQQNVSMYANLEWELKLGMFSSLAEKYIAIEEMLCDKLRSFIPMTEKVYCTYNPLEYAKEVHDNWVLKFCASKKKVLFVGMNPGPFGMGQTGVPFGEVAAVRDYMGLHGNIAKPAYEHPKRPIAGFSCKRSEVSGARFWALFRKIFPDARDFFEHGYVCNYCPLIFMNEHGKNIIPPSLLKLDRNILFNHCDRALGEAVRLLEIDMMVCVGKFVYNRAGDILAKFGLDKVRRLYMMHPSPVQPAASKDWEVVALQQLEEAGVIDLLRGKAGAVSDSHTSIESHTPLSTATDMSSDHSTSTESCGTAENSHDDFSKIDIKSEFRGISSGYENSAATIRGLYDGGTPKSVLDSSCAEVT